MTAGMCGRGADGATLSERERQCYPGLVNICSGVVPACSLRARACGLRVVVVGGGGGEDLGEDRGGGFLRR